MARVKGTSSLIRVLRRLPLAVREEVAGAMRESGIRLLTNARVEVPVRSGRLRRALNYKVNVKSLQLLVGLIDKPSRKKFFYGYILDQGRAAKTVAIERGKRAGTTMRISPIAQERYNFVFGRRRDFKDNELPSIRKAFERALTKAIKGSGND